MEENNKREEKVYNYIHNRMSEAEKAVFLREMDEDAELKADVELLFEMKRGMNDSRPWQYAEEIKQLIRENASMPSITRTRQAKVIRYIAGFAAVLLVAFTVYYMYAPPRYSSQFALAATETVSIDAQLDSLFPSIARGGVAKDDWISALTKEKKFDVFLEKARTDFSHRKDDRKLNYALIHYLLFKGMSAEAAETFSHIPEDMQKETGFQYLQGFIEIAGGAGGNERALAIFGKLDQALPTGHALKANVQAVLVQLQKAIHQ